jgi:molybdate transport system regulatory protein
MTGSLAEAARRMGMSYMRAWKLIKTMNQCFREPLVILARGGKKGGGAHLSETGQRVLALYHRMEADCLQSTKAEWRELKALLTG